MRHLIMPAKFHGRNAECSIEQVGIERTEWSSDSKEAFHFLICHAKCDQACPPFHAAAEDVGKMTAKGRNTHNIDIKVKPIEFAPEPQTPTEFLQEP